MIPFDGNEIEGDNDDAICEKWPHYLFVWKSLNPRENSLKEK